MYSGLQVDRMWEERLDSWTRQQKDKFYKMLGISGIVYVTTMSGVHKARATKFCTMELRILWSSLWNLPHVTLLAHRILSWFLDFWEIWEMPLPCVVSQGIRNYMHNAQVPVAYFEPYIWKRFWVNVFNKETIRLPAHKTEFIVEDIRHEEAALDENPRYDTRDYGKSPPSYFTMMQWTGRVFLLRT